MNDPHKKNCLKGKYPEANMRYAVKALLHPDLSKKNRQVIAAEGEQKASKALREASMVILWLTLDFIIIVLIVVIFIVIIVIITVITVLLMNIFPNHGPVITIKMNYCPTQGDG